MSEQYECDCCGECCRHKLIDVFPEDVLREPKIDQRMLPLREPGLDGRVGYLDSGQGGRCCFLAADKRCAIHPTRPVVCVLFPAGGDACQEARLHAGLPPLEPKVDEQDSRD